MLERKLALAGALLVVCLGSAACAGIVGADFSEWKASNDTEDAGSAAQPDLPPEPPAGRPEEDAQTSSPVDPDACKASCAGQACGADDGCGGTCADGACGDGLRCIAGKCACDAKSCAGCCEGSTCRSGTQLQACGGNGVACAKCGAGEGCYESACTLLTPVCENYVGTGSRTTTCAQVCHSIGQGCTAGCVTDQLTLVSAISRNAGCTGPFTSLSASCNTPQTVTAGQALFCCCT